MVWVHMPLHHFSHHLHLCINKNCELTEYYGSVAFKNFAIGLIGIFEPIYLYLYFDQSLTQLFLFFGVISFFFALAVPLGAKLVARFGIKHSMIASLPFFFLYILGLWQIDALGAWFPILIVVNVIYKMLYWPAFHMDFSRFADQGRKGRELSYRFLTAMVTGTVAPAIGGFILLESGFPMLFIVVLVTLVFAGAALLFTKDSREPYDDSFERAYSDLIVPKKRNAVIAFASDGIESTSYLLLLPLFFYIVQLNFGAMGLVVSGATVFAMLFSIYLGRAVDRSDARRIMRIGSLLNAILWPVNALIVSPLTAFLAHTAHQFGRVAAFLPFGTLFYEWTSAKRGERGRRIILRELSLNGARAVMLFVLAGLFALWEPATLRWIFPATGIVALGFLFFLRMIPKPSVSTIGASVVVPVSSGKE